MERLQKWGDYKQILKDAKPYYSGLHPEGIKFRYMSPNYPDLVQLREQFKLDSVAGAGDEISKIKNALRFIYKTEAFIDIKDAIIYNNIDFV